jgi:hypothetical protein
MINLLKGLASITRMICGPGYSTSIMREAQLGISENETPSGIRLHKSVESRWVNIIVLGPLFSVLWCRPLKTSVPHFLNLCDVSKFFEIGASKFHNIWVEATTSTFQTFWAWPNSPWGRWNQAARIPPP